MNLYMQTNPHKTMNSTLIRKVLVATFLGICLINLQHTSIAIEVEESHDDVVVITVDSTNLQFSPAEVVINEGQTIRFFWSGEFLEHNAIDSNGFFNTGSPETEVDYSFTFDKGTNNTYSFICEPHEALNMVGTIVVNPAANETMYQDTNQTGPQMKTISEESNSLFGFLVIPTLIAVILVSRYFR